MQRLNILTSPTQKEQNETFITKGIIVSIKDMTDTIVLSVIIPFFNASRYIERCLKSLQKISSNQIEFICINDGSSDDSINICMDCIKNDDRFLIISKKHEGVAKARIRGIHESKGLYITFVDSDDYITGNWNQIIRYLALNRYDSIIHSSNIISNNLIPEWILKSTKTNNMYVPNFQFKHIFEIDCCRPFIWQHIVKRKYVIESIKYYDDTINLGEDQALAIIYLSMCSKVLFLDNKCYCYCINKDSTMSYYNNNIREKINEHIKIATCIINYLPSDNPLILKWLLELFTDYEVIEEEHNYKKIKPILKRYLPYIDKISLSEEDYNLIHDFFNNFDLNNNKTKQIKKLTSQALRVIKQHYYKLMYCTEVFFIKLHILKTDEKV